MADLSLRTRTFTDSVIRRMTRISNQYHAVNLSQGFPDWDPPKEMEQRLSQVAFTGPHQLCRDLGRSQLPPGPGRQAETLYRPRHRPGNGDRHHLRQHGSAMMVAVMAVTNPGVSSCHRVLSRLYENYGADAILSGAEPIYVPLVPPEYHFDADVLEAALNSIPRP